jgi:hypothetical protein
MTGWWEGLPRDPAGWAALGLALAPRVAVLSDDDLVSFQGLITAVPTSYDEVKRVPEQRDLVTYPAVWV